MSILRQSAKNAPHCMGCYRPNPNGDLCCLAHSNELRHGRGIGHKSDDIHGAILCADCHDIVDGRKGGRTKAEKHGLHRMAHENTVVWWVDNGYLGPRLEVLQ